MFLILLNLSPSNSFSFESFDLKSFMKLKVYQENPIFLIADSFNNFTLFLKPSLEKNPLLI